MSIRNLWIYGDSLSTGTHGENAYLDALKKEMDFENFRNFSVGSSGLTEHTPNSMVSILKKQLADLEPIPEKPDVIFIWHGSNDWYWGSSIGEVLLDDNASFAGAIRWVVENLRAMCPDALIIWATPIFRLEKPNESDNYGDAFLTPNKNGNMMGEYVEALRNASLLLHFPLIEMGQKVNIHMANEADYMEDHVHPNAKGYHKIARVLIRQIKEYWDIVS